MDKIEISQLVRSRRRTVALMITPDAKLKVYAPFRASLAYIEQVVNSKAAWIARKVSQVTLRPKHDYLLVVEGGPLYYLGQPYVVVFNDDSRIRLSDKLYFPRELLAQARQEMSFWYRQEAAKIVPARVKFYADILGLQYRSVLISTARTRWGSCSPQDDLRFSWRLIMAPLDVVDYVVVHELAHLIVRNHSQRFWNKVAEFFPNYVSCRVWLRQNAHLIRSQ